MGITINRAIGMFFSVLVFFIPVFCAVKWFAQGLTLASGVRVAGFCLLSAIVVVVAINVAARWSVAGHPRPVVCLPNRVVVPSSP